MFTQEFTAGEIGHVPAKGNTNRGLSGRDTRITFIVKTEIFDP